MANSETRVCQNCKQQFTIETDDFSFYERIGVPAPKFCPSCREQRRHAWRNDLCFYNRKCDLCKRDIISLYSSEKPYRVYCNKCWWSDSWEPRDYGRDIDFSRPFFEQFRELQNEVPLIALVNDDGIASTNCEYTQNVSFSRDCYMVSMTWFSQNALYGVQIPDTKDTADCIELFGGNQWIYDSVFLNKCYNCRNCYYSFSLNDCSFCYNCTGCSNCFLCVGLKNKQYHILNKPYSKEEYKKILKSYHLEKRSGVKIAMAEFKKILLRYPMKFAIFRNCVDCIGDALLNCKNAKYCFDARAVEDSRYFEGGNEIKDCYDLTVGGKAIQCYEGLTADRCYGEIFTIFCWGNQNVTYCENCHNSKHLFGCAGLKKNEYCILNKQYTKEEYEVLKNKLIDHMKRTGEWGEFFPAHFSHFGYNETRAVYYHPLTKEEAIQKGFKWWDKLQFTVGKETLKEVPDSIDDVGDSIIKEILVCEKCSRNYRIVHAELQFYRTMKIPIPVKCFFCRYEERFSEMKHPIKLWHRKCQCAGKKSENGIYTNTTTHPHHGTTHCPNEFETSYAPDRPEIVYCEQCYNSEVV
jgi:hypothetical protein